jgi:hypothetical protein
MKEMDLP